MQPAVRELVRALQREVVEREELLDASEVEEAVAADVPCDPPEEEPEQRACAEHAGPRRNGALGASPKGCGQGREPRYEHEHERQREGGRDEERDGERAEDERERPGERRGGAAQAEGTGEDRPGREHHGESEDELREEPDRAHRRPGTDPEGVCPP